MDVALLEKKKVIEYQMTLVKEKMTKIKKNAIQIQTQIQTQTQSQTQTQTNNNDDDDDDDNNNNNNSTYITLNILHL